MKSKLIFSGIVSLLLCSGTTNAQAEMISRDALYEIALSGNSADLEDLFFEAHQAMSKGEISADDLRHLNAMLIVTHPDILAASEKWLSDYPASIYAQTLVSFQIRSAAWRVRGGGTARDTHPDALASFDALNERSFELAWAAFNTAPGYIPASDAVIKLNSTMNVFWDYEIEAIIADTMEQVPNIGTIARASFMHLPQWGGRGVRGIRDHCKKYIASIVPSIGLTSSNCTDLFVLGLPFSQEVRDRAASGLADFSLEGFESSIVEAIMLNRDESRHVEVRRYLERNGPMYMSHISLANNYAQWRRTDDLRDLIRNVSERARSTALEALHYDPFNTQYLGTIQQTDYLDPGPHPAEESRAKRLDMFARQVGGHPFFYGHWSNLARSVVSSYGFEASRPYFTNAMAYNVDKEEASYEVLGGLNMHLQNLLRAKEQGRVSPEGFQESKGAINCEIVRIVRLNAQLCKSDPSGHAASCNPFQPGYARMEYEVVEIEALIEGAMSRSLSCPRERQASLEQLMYQPVQTDLTQFLIDRRPQEAQ